MSGLQPSMFLGPVGEMIWGDKLREREQKRAAEDAVKKNPPPTGGDLSEQAGLPPLTDDRGGLSPLRMLKSKRGTMQSLLG